MNTKRNTLILVSTAIALSMALPASAQSVRLKGNTMASPELQSATVTQLMERFTPATQCEKPERIEPKTLAIQPRLNKAKKPIGLAKVKEQWTVNGCGKQRSYQVVYTLDEKKGTHIEISDTK